MLLVANHDPEVKVIYSLQAQLKSPGFPGSEFPGPEFPGSARAAAGKAEPGTRPSSVPGTNAN